ncbi:MAG: PDZ domain-containing protein [Gemmatimonadales bacterium]|nr:MAG: PDZ domain-containing protein [Gemmatimonadales bacterium]
MASHHSAPVRPATGSTVIIGGLALAMAVGMMVPGTLMAQDPPPPPAEETTVIPEELREAMERLRSERAAVMELMQELRETDQAAARALMREFQGEGPLLGLQQRRQAADGARMQGQRGQGAGGPGMQGQRRQGGDGPGIQGQRGQGAGGPGMQRQGQQRQAPAARGIVGRTALMPGVSLHPLNPDLARYFEVESGILVLERHEDSFLPVEAGDVIVTVDGREPEDQAHLRRLLVSYRPGDSLTLEVVRQGRSLTLEAEVPSPVAGEG